MDHMGVDGRHEATAVDKSSMEEAVELALDERTTMRRVPGLSTELQDISEVEYRKLRLERVVLVGVWTEGSAEDAEHFERTWRAANGEQIYR